MISSLHDSAPVIDWETTLELPSKALSGPYWVEVAGAEQRVGFALALGESAMVGSARGLPHRVEDDAVSARHCELSAGPLGVTVSDLGSRNGTFVGGARVSSALLGAAETSFVVGRSVVTVRPRGAAELKGATGPEIPGLTGGSAAMLSVRELVRRWAPLRAPVLITGESGTGKDVVARALHALGRPRGPFVPLNVGALSENLADSELFGHQRGAFTGAVSARAGAFEQAHDGTLFLDEIADLASPLQVKLLRAVEDGAVRSLGAARETRVDVRVISACWADLQQRVSTGRFREDLLHRLGVFVLRLPPLRERRGDLPELARSLLARFERDLGPRTLSSDALARLSAYAFPGNVRELGSVLYRAAAATDGSVIEAEHVVMGAGGAARLRRNMSRAEAELWLAQHGGNASAAARAAGVARTTFREWLAQAPRDRRLAARDAVEREGDAGRDGSDATE
jgi:DNA-binding NtrC family response regulator